METIFVFVEGCIDDSPAGCLGIVLVPVLVIAAACVYWGNIRLYDPNPAAALFAVDLGICCVVGSRIAWVFAEDFPAIVGMCFGTYMAGAFEYAAVALAEEYVGGYLGIGDALVMILATPIIMAGASLPILLIQTLIVWLAVRKRGQGVN